MRNRVETFGIFATEVNDPTIVGAGISSGEFRILHRAFPKDPQRGIQNGDVDLFVIHDSEARFGVVTTSRGPFSVGHHPTREQLLAIHADPANGAEISAHALTLVRVVIDDEI